MPEVDQSLLEAFGKSVHLERPKRGWTQDRLSTAMGGACGKSMISRIEKGKQLSLTPRIVGLLVSALEMDESVHTAFVQQVSASDKVRRDDAEKLVERAKRDHAAPQVAETLLQLLAYEHAGGPYLDPQTAYISLRKALEAAQAMRAAGQLRGNADTQLSRVMARVADLNELGEMDDADALLEEEEQRMQAEQERLEEAARQLLHQRLNQDRLRNDPAAAADRLIRDLIRQAPAGGVFRATSDMIDEWRKRGETQGDPFDLRVALILANRNMDRAKGPQKGAALFDLGKCRRSIGERRADLTLLHAAEKAFRAALAAFPKARDPRNWAACQMNLGSTLRLLGARQQDPDLLHAAIAAHRAALTIWSKEKTPQDWARSQDNLGSALKDLGELKADLTLLQDGLAAYDAALSVWTKAQAPEDWADTDLNRAIALRAMGRLTQDPAHFDAAQTAYEDALTVWTPESARYEWANVIGGLGELALDRFALDQNPKHLDEAETRLLDARKVMSQSDDFLAERCDALLAQIAAARSGS